MFGFSLKYIHSRFNDLIHFLSSYSEEIFRALARHTDSFALVGYIRSLRIATWSGTLDMTTMATIIKTFFHSSQNVFTTVTIFRRGAKALVSIKVQVQFGHIVFTGT